MTNQDDICFSLTPHRSLSQRGFLLVMGFLIAVSFVAGLGFLLLGAWPVTGLFGLDVLLVWAAFRLNYAGAEREERIALDPRHVTVERRVRGEIKGLQLFDRPWASVVLEVDKERDLIGRLLLVQSGKRCEIGAFLSPAERQDFARELSRRLR